MPLITHSSLPAIRAPSVRSLVLLCCVLLGLISEASSGAMSLALRPAARDLHADQATIQLAALISKMFFGAFMLAGGVIGDIFGRRRILLWGSAAILVASLAAAAAISTGMLVAARALDGIANAAIGPLSLAMALAVFSPEQQSKVVSLYLGLSVLGVAFGPVIAGWLIQAFGWRTSFALPAALAIVGGLGILTFAPNQPRAVNRPRLDGLGVFMSVVGLLGVVYALALANTFSWMYPKTIQALVIGSVSLVAFIWWERRSRDPLLDLSIFQNRTATLAIVTGATFGLILSGMMLPLLYFLQSVYGLTPASATLRMTPLVLSAALFSPVVGVMMKRIGPRKVIVIGGLLMAIGSLIIAIASVESRYAALVISLSLIGAGYIAVITAVADVILSALPRERAGSAAAVNGAAIQIGGAFGIVIFVSVFLSGARPVYFGRLESLNLPVNEIRILTKNWRDAVQDSIATGDRVLPEAFREQFKLAWHDGFIAGVDRIFAVSAFLSFACAALVWFGAKPASNAKRNPQSHNQTAAEESYET
ncbi:MAG TPA: MFS transporter [Verrucomicrobiae bacterium]|nr:MFS transporter [Verrucomicrobiae bacterium]